MAVGLKQKVLITPLNWGLGHATRCIPIIDYLLKEDVGVYIASDNEAGKLLQQQFPDIPYFELSSYDVRYNSTNMARNLISQSPKILTTIGKETEMVSQIVRKYGINTVISDNRFGCRSKDSYNIFITHQVRVLYHAKLISLLANKINHHWISKFDEVWVPDFPESPSLTGIMSHDTGIEGLKYIGPISRFQPMSCASRYDIMVLLSGPEPMRTQLEEILAVQLENYQGRALFVRGVFQGKPLKINNPNVEVINFINGEPLNEAICSSDLIICRSGYTTVMDLATTGAKAVMVPTPGQPEQEYLAKLLHNQKTVYSVTQDKFELKDAIEQSRKYNGFKPVKEVNIGLKNEIIPKLTNEPVSYL